MVSCGVCSLCPCLMRCTASKLAQLLLQPAGVRSHITSCVCVGGGGAKQSNVMMSLEQGSLAL